MHLGQEHSAWRSSGGEPRCRPPRYRKHAERIQIQKEKRLSPAWTFYVAAAIEMPKSPGCYPPTARAARFIQRSPSYRFRMNFVHNRCANHPEINPTAYTPATPVSVIFVRVSMAGSYCAMLSYPILCCATLCCTGRPCGGDDDGARGEGCQRWALETGVRRGRGEIGCVSCTYTRGVF